MRSHPSAVGTVVAIVPRERDLSIQIVDRSLTKLVNWINGDTLVVINVVMRVEIKTSHGATRSARFGVKRWTIERDLNNRDDIL